MNPEENCNAKPDKAVRMVPESEMGWRGSESFERETGHVLGHVAKDSGRSLRASRVRTYSKSSPPRPKWQPVHVAEANSRRSSVLTPGPVPEIAGDAVSGAFRHARRSLIPSVLRSQKSGRLRGYLSHSTSLRRTHHQSMHVLPHDLKVIPTAFRTHFAELGSLSPGLSDRDRVFQQNK